MPQLQSGLTPRLVLRCLLDSRLRYPTASSPLISTSSFPCPQTMLLTSPKLRRLRESPGRSPRGASIFPTAQAKPQGILCSPTHTMTHPRSKLAASPPGAPPSKHEREPLLIGTAAPCPHQQRSPRPPHALLTRCPAPPPWPIFLRSQGSSPTPSTSPTHHLLSCPCPS